MTNLMRKHGKVLMTVFSAGLMLVFVIQATVTGSRDRSGQTEKGKLNGKTVVASDLYEASSDLTILSSVRVMLSLQGQPLPASVLEVLVAGKFYMGRYQLIPPTVALSADEGERTLQWFLLLKEAEKMGVPISDTEISETISQMRLSDEDLSSELSAIKVTPKRFQLAVGHALQLRALSLMGMGAVETSLPRVELEADKLLSTADVTVATIDGAKDWEKSPAPTEEQIKKQFDLYKGVLPWTENSPEPPAEVNGHRYPFGYKYPDRVKVEYLRFDRAELAKQFTVTEEDQDAAFKYYTDNPKDPRFIAKSSATQVMGPTTEAASQPAIKKWADVREELIKDEMSKRVDKVLKKVVDRARTLADEGWKSVDTEGGYKKVPTPDKWPDYQKIADEIARNKEYGGFQPSYNAVTGFLGEADLAKLKGIGDAYYETQQQRREFPVLATHVKELVGVGNKDPMADMFLEVGPEGPTLHDDNGDIYIYRVTAAEKSREPGSVDEVRGQVVTDLKKVAAYEQAKTVAKDLAEKAKAGDLLGLAKSKSVEVEQANDVNQQHQTVGMKVGYVSGLVDAIFAITHEAAATQPVVNGKRVSPTTTLAKDDSFKVYVIELSRYNPVSPAIFAAQRNEVVRQSEINDKRMFVMSWTSLPALMERMHFVPAPGMLKTAKEEE